MGRRFLLSIVLAGAMLPRPAAAGEDAVGSEQALLRYQCGTLRSAIEDLLKTCGPRYPNGREYLRQLDRLSDELDGNPAAVRERLEQLQREALLANPLLAFDEVLLVKRKSMATCRPRRTGRSSFPNEPGPGPRVALQPRVQFLAAARGLRQRDRRPVAGSAPGAAWPRCIGPRPMAMSARWICTGTPSGCCSRSPTRPTGRSGRSARDGTGLRQVSQMPDDVDCFDACYLPDGRIVFGSTASYQAVPCWHGLKLGQQSLPDERRRLGRAAALLRPGPRPAPGRADERPGALSSLGLHGHQPHLPARADGDEPRRHRPAGRLREQFLVSELPVLPAAAAGGQQSGSSASCPAITACTGWASSCWSTPSRGWHEADGHRPADLRPRRPDQPDRSRDNLVDDDWPKFLHPYPLSDKYFLVACWPDAKSRWGIYLADVFDNLVLLREEPGYALLEPVPMLTAAQAARDRGPGRPPSHGRRGLSAQCVLGLRAWRACRGDGQEPARDRLSFRLSGAGGAGPRSAAAGRGR